jgi:hypothetical protein
MVVTLIMKRLKRPRRLLPTSMKGAATRCELLAQFLNAPLTSLDDRRVAEVFRYCQQLKDLEPSSSLAANRRRAINAHLSEIRVVTVLQPNGDWDWKAGHPGRTKQTEVSPAYALKVIAELASNQMLERMRQCRACTKWFFARTNKKIVCSDACRSAKFKQADLQAYKQHRAEYMRGYRKTRRVPGVRKWMKTVAEPTRSR